ncbi:MAG: hypothetical protein QF839_02270 [Candidatus Poseidoniaceae archaeon]|nr:hypothetical protein [Candidatus Poseidoniaceae archaeon]
MDDVWLVARCPACSLCHGAKGVTHRCPHCGHRTPSPMEVVDRAASAAELQVKVTLANTPEELRDELRARMGTPRTQRAQDHEDSPKVWYAALREAANDEGQVTLEALANALRRRASTTPVPEVIEHAMANGLLFEEEKDLWMLLGDQRSG